MKKTGIISLKGIFFIVAIQILNLSICVDYIATDSRDIQVTVHYDDINSFAEFVLEKIISNRIITSENEADDESPMENDLEKYETGPLYLEHIPHHQLLYAVNNGSSWATGLANKTSKGHFNIISPPPKS